jgi:hypothetical protein
MSITKLISIGGFGVGELGNVSNVILANGVITTSKIDITGNVTGGNLATGGLISATGNITSAANIGGGNVNATLYSGTTVSVTGVITGASVVGGVITGSSASVTGIVTGASVVGGVITGTTVSTTGNITSAANITGGNITTAGIITATGNITSGNISTGTITVTGAVVPRVVVITDAASVTIDGDTTDIATQANTQAVGTLTINAVTGTPFNGQKIIFRLQSTNVQTFSWNAVFVGSTDLSLPTTSSGTSKYDYVGFIYNSTATKWQLLAKNFGF